MLVGTHVQQGRISLGLGRVRSCISVLSRGVELVGLLWWLESRVRLEANQLVVRVVVLLSHLGSHQGGILWLVTGWSLRCRVGHCLSTSRLVQSLGNRWHIVQHKHVQVFLQILVRLCLRHDIALHRYGSISVCQLVSIKQVLCLVQNAAGLSSHIHGRLRAHVQSIQRLIAHTACRLLAIEIQIQRLRLHPIWLMLCHCLKSSSRVSCQSAQV